jgi:hypothetical protein
LWNGRTLSIDANPTADVTFKDVRKNALLFCMSWLILAKQGVRTVSDGNIAEQADGNNVSLQAQHFVFAGYDQSQLLIPRCGVPIAGNVNELRRKYQFHPILIMPIDRIRPSIFDHLEVVNGGACRGRRSSGIAHRIQGLRETTGSNSQQDNTATPAMALIHSDLRKPARSNNGGQNDRHRIARNVIKGIANSFPVTKGRSSNGRHPC